MLGGVFRNERKEMAMRDRCGGREVRKEGGKGRLAHTHPLSEVKNTSVLLSTPASLRAANISPTPQSISLRASPNFSRLLVLVNFCPANCGWWVCWKAMYRKNGVPWAGGVRTITIMPQ